MIRAALVHRARFGPGTALFVIVTVVAASLLQGDAGAAPGGGRSLEALTRNLLDRAEANADPGRSAAVLGELVALAEERRALLADLAETDPAAVLEGALSAEQVAALPPGLRDKLEREVELEGEVTALYEDYEDHAVLRHFLEAPGGRRSLHFAGDPPELLSGDRVRVRGVEVPLPSGSDTSGAVVAYCCNADSFEMLAAVEVPNTFGEQRTLVLLVNFTDKPEQPWSVAQARQFVFGGASSFFRENSYGQTWLAGDVYGWFTIAYDSTSCDAVALSGAADQAAEAAGIDVSAYGRRVYAFPRIACYWDGLAGLGGSPSSAWINNGLHDARVVAHELGHNLGLDHSHGIDCVDRVLAPEEQCYYAEYGDPFDTMGGSLMHFNAAQKERLGWLGYGSSPPITTVGSSGTYAIEPYAPPGAGPKALRILRSVDPTTGQRTFFYLEYRQAFGFDSFLTDASNPFAAYMASIPHGVLVHLAVEGAPQGTTFLDMTPSSQLYDDFDSALHAGESYFDPESGIAFSTVATDGARATVSVSLSGSSCTASAPSVALSPAPGPSVAPGTPVGYTVTVSNRDASGCAASRFDLSASLPSGWSASLGAASLRLDPGQSGTTTLQVVSPSSAANGTYAFSVRALDPQLAGHSGTASGTYSVGSGTSNAPPVARDDAATTSAGTAVVVPVLANDSDPDGDPLRVESVSQGAQGSVVVNPDSTVAYRPGSGARRSDTFQYTVTDGRSRASASVTVKLSRTRGPKN